MEIKEWCAPSIQGTVRYTLETFGFVGVECSACGSLHKALIVGNSFKSRNTVAPKKEKAPVEPVEWVDGHGRPTAPPEYVS